jgi:hypothetical protein
MNPRELERRVRKECLDIAESNGVTWQEACAIVDEAMDWPEGTAQRHASSKSACETGR